MYPSAIKGEAHRGKRFPRKKRATSAAASANPRTSQEPPLGEVAARAALSHSFVDQPVIWANPHLTSRELEVRQLSIYVHAPRRIYLAGARARERERKRDRQRIREREALFDVPLFARGNVSAQPRREEATFLLKREVTPLKLARK